VPFYFVEVLAQFELLYEVTPSSSGAEICDVESVASSFIWKVAKICYSLGDSPLY